MEKLYYTPREVATALSISDDAVLDLIDRGDLPALRVSPRIIRIPIAAFDLWRAGVMPKRRRVAIRPTTRGVGRGAWPWGLSTHTKASNRVEPSSLVEIHV